MRMWNVRCSSQAVEDALEALPNNTSSARFFVCGDNNGEGFTSHLPDEEEGCDPQGFVCTLNMDVSYRECIKSRWFE